MASVRPVRRYRFESICAPDARTQLRALESRFEHFANRLPGAAVELNQSGV
jgi:hypothetical protein